jgi:hypothetical protein
MWCSAQLRGTPHVILEIIECLPSPLGTQAIGTGYCLMIALLLQHSQWSEGFCLQRLGTASASVA